MKNAILIIALFGLPLLGFAQGGIVPVKPDCDSLIRAGDTHLRRQNLQQALQCYLGAMNCNSQLAGQIGPKIDTTFQRINQSQKSEKRARIEAQAALVRLKKEQIQKYHTKAEFDRQNKRYDDAIRAYRDEQELYDNQADKSRLESLITETTAEKNNAEFEQNRNIGLSMKAAHNCKSALIYFMKAKSIKSDDAILNKAIEECH